ncbi:AAA family ATPase [Chryseobacterium gleum]|uniref:AAA family ATPase n=1 Tax=Chryseobacterium gleum TaxID=250 RepID=UPI0031DDC140
MAGYIFKELRLTGENKQDAIVQFKHGLNVISGPSNTGKTFIFDCLDFMLGSSDKLKGIPEIKGYSNIFLEIEGDDQSYTIETEIKNNNTYKLYRSKINKLNTEPEILKRKLDSNSKDNLNSFFLNLNKIDNKKIRKNAKGDTISLSYRNVVKFALIDEERIITKESPIVSHYTRETEESNTLRFFLTGNDDSSIIKKISSQEIQRRKGKIDLLHEFINNANIDSNLNSDEIESQLERINVSLNNFTLNFNRIKKDYLSVETDYTNKNIEYVEFNKRHSEITELLKRSYILEQQYNSDILRLKSTIESGIFMSENSEASCPTCQQEITTKTLDIEQIIISCESEIQKITSLLKELKISQTLISAEEKDIEKKLSSTITELEQLRIKLHDGIGIELEKTIETLTNLNNKKSQLIGIQDIISKTNSFSQTIKELESSIPTSKANFPTLTSDVTKKLCKKMSEILKEIGENKTVNYSRESFEFEIGNSFRNTYGKGYRAIYYSVYIIALHEIMEDNTFKIGVPVLDSPLVTYKKPNASGEGIDLNLAMDFYRYLSKTKIKQTIIIENEVPPQDILNRVNHIQFKGFGDGFIPK